MERSVKVNFWDIEPGWSCIYFTRPPRLKKSRLHSLFTFLEDWRRQHPMRRIERVQVAKDRRLVRGLNVYWSIFEHLQERLQIKQFQIDEEIRELYGHEYAEALMQDAAAFASRPGAPSGNIVLVSRRRVAVVLVRNSAQAYVTRLEKFQTMIAPDMAEDILKNFKIWLSLDEPGYFCAILPGNFRGTA